ncbi:DUF4236 domain-containing protein [Mucilaginibacter sp.]|uniref:DUF4236 domain-containing protein n=1 Tax=Mucilaginibacter sp. TaxID=1882438 RepID=UPI002850C295|nr:DUF4236 domain-containing protein [Mucilaginibacter sp.]MDR3696811.1 DUF4236 domain-containing protein [Mucilaginibacter sp.]
MGFRFRKTVKMGPVNLNFSKSGIGTSIGGKGFRMGVNAKGRSYTTASIPKTGISYTSYGKATSRKTYASPASSYTNSIPQFYNADNLSPKYFDLLFEYKQISGQNGCLMLFAWATTIVLCFTITWLGLLAVSALCFYQYKVNTNPINVKRITLIKGQKLFSKYRYIETINTLSSLALVEINDFAINHLVGLANYNLSCYKEAIVYFERAFDNTPRDKRTILFLAHSYEQLTTDDALNKSISYYEKFLEIDPQDEAVKFAISKGLFAVKDYDSAVFYLQTIKENSSNFLKALNAIAGCFVELKKPDLAIEALKKAPLLKRNLDDDLKLTHYLLGSIYHELGDKQQALKHLNKVYAQDITYKDISAQLTYLSE